MGGGWLLTELLTVIREKGREDHRERIGTKDFDHEKWRGKLKYCSLRIGIFHNLYNAFMISPKSIVQVFFLLVFQNIHCHILILFEITCIDIFALGVPGGSNVIGTRRNLARAMYQMSGGHNTEQIFCRNGDQFVYLGFVEQ